MNMPNKFNQLKESALVYWNGRTEQERRFLAIGGAVVALALLYAVFIDPALTGRAQLRKALPELRQQAAQVQSLAAEAAELARQPVTQVVPMTRESLTSSLAARGLKAETITLTGEVARVQVKGASFAGLVTWLDAQRRESHVTAQDVNLVAQGGEGLVDGAVTLRQAAGGAQ